MNTSHVKLIFVTILCILMISGAFYYTNYQKKQLRESVTTVSTESEPNNSMLVEEDTGQWREQFIKTSSSTIKTASPGVVEENTLTSKLGATFFVNFIDLKNNNQIDDSESVQNSIDQIVASVADISDKPTMYDLSDIKISSNNSPESIKLYANNIALLYKKYGPRSEISTELDYAASNNSLDNLIKMDSIVSSITKSISELSLVPAPSSLQNEHLDFINGLSLMKNVAKGLRKFDSDPVQTLMAIGNYVTANDALYNTMTDIKIFLEISKIVFTANEPGIIFNTEI